MKDKYINCYYPPVNILHLSDNIFILESSVYEYTKHLYEQGLDHKATPPQREEELQEFFRWKVRYKSTNRLFRWLIDLLMKL